MHTHIAMRFMQYMFVSNSDNLGATLDLALLTHFAESGSAFMMECVSLPHRCVPTAMYCCGWRVI